jgi:threonylcarbamoyladenosine tRNA methylthiotransferase MtaB
VPTFSIENFGCRATDADAAALRRSLLASGLTVLGEHAADFVVLNTCTVTANADAQARDAVRKIHRANPKARIIVTGCYAQRAPDEIASLEGVTWVVGNSHQTEIPELLEDFQSEQFSNSQIDASLTGNNFVPLSRLSDDAMSLARGPAKILSGDIFAQTSVQLAPHGGGLEGDRTRPILKVQDGCNNRCSYCVIPFVRGRSRSLAPDVVVEEVRKLVASGVKEIVLSGINLGSYGRDFIPRAALSEVVRRILDETDLEQLRFSSVEPQDVTEDFVALVASSERIARHFHVPLQSGSDKVLRGMHRWYRAAHYAERIRRIRNMVPDAAIGADVIVGFPGETDEDFRMTHDFIEALPVTYLHVFSFSSRPGTKAADSNASVDPAVIRERAHALRALSQRKATEFRASQQGRKVRAITLARGGADWTEALTSNYLKVKVPGHLAANLWCEAEISLDERAIGNLELAADVPASSRR